MPDYLKAEISESAVRANISVLKGHLSTGVKLCAVVKSNCYGHGVELLLPVIAEQADWLAVAGAEEALELRRLGYNGPALMFFSPFAYRDENERRKALEEILRAGITLTVSAPEAAEAIDTAAQRAGRTAAVHVMIDTGMHRSGVQPELAAALVEQVRTMKHLAITGAYTHFAAADEEDKTFTREQSDMFDSVLADCRLAGPIVRHAANSAASIDLPETHMDMVRAGIPIYGYHPSGALRNRLPLRPCLRLTSALMQVKNLAAGERIGYGLTYRLPSPTRVGLVPIGYGDGYLRCLSNRAVMKVRGAIAPIRGRISMDQTVIDLGNVPGAQVGDEAEIVSSDPSSPNSVENLAAIAGTIPYEIVCVMGLRRIRRELVP